MIEVVLVLAIGVAGILLAGMFVKLLAGLIAVPIHLGVGLIKVIVGLLAIPAIILVTVVGTVMLPLLLVLAIPFALAALVCGLFA